MRTRGRTAVLLAAVLLSSSPAHAEPRPKHWFKDWKWWVGEAFIAGIRAADAHSSVTAQANCPACYETNFFLGKHPSTGALAGMAGAGFGILTTLHILSWKYCPDERSRWWRAASYSLVPGVSATAIPGIVHNYSLASQSRPVSLTSPSSATFGRAQRPWAGQAGAEAWVAVPRAEKPAPVPKPLPGCGHTLTLCLAPSLPLAPTPRVDLGMVQPR